MAERRYGEDEVAAIFRYATEEHKARPLGVPDGDGLTLADVQQIGRDVGIEPSVIAQAAARLDQGAGTSVRTFLGLPIRVGRSVELGRTVTDAEWERLVVDLDEIFNAHGAIDSGRTTRSWRNGNLRVTIEPSASGSRLRMGTYNENADRVMRIGLMLGGVAAVGALISAAGHSHEGFGSLGLIGAIMFGVCAVRLPWWGRRRLAQMKDVADRLLGTPIEPTD